MGFSNRSSLHSFNCFVQYLDNMYNDGATKETCAANPFAPECILVQNLMDGPLYKFTMCAGFELDTANTSCVEAPGASFATYTHFATSGLKNGIEARNACVANVHPIATFLKDDCASCYTSLIQDIYVMNAQNPEVGVVEIHTLVNARVPYPWHSTGSLNVRASC